ncbi:ABC transporter permease [Thalassoglobus neptunius]|uniref:ABC transporter permease n=1 Tax=Thalassoglobus neptunius TaxID=1938619 RepID=UPI001E5B743E|nr:ABC transporter permease [Thalassoglobus neptunius]
MILILLFLIAAHLHESTSSAPGLDLFRSIAFLAIALINLAGVGHFCNSITEEKEEGTLSLLLLANISPLGILLGKSTNRILSVILIFAAQFPFALLAVTLGGITVLQIVATFLALSAHLFLIANLSLLMSVWSRRSQEAAAAMVMVLMILYGFPYAVYQAARQARRSTIFQSAGLSEWSDWLLDLNAQISVVDQVQRILGTDGDYQFLSWQLISSLIFGTIAFLIAWASFCRIIWAPDTDRPTRMDVKTRSRWKSILIPRAWRQAVTWKDYYFIAGGISGLIARVVFYSISLLIMVFYRRKIYAQMEIDGVQLFRDLLLVLLCIETLVLASQFFHTERKSGTLPTLLMLPQTPLRITWEKAFGCFLGVLPTIVFLFIPESFLQERYFFESFVLTPRMLTLICGLLVMAHLTALCSLIVKWGALPLAIGLALIAGGLFAPFIAVAKSLIRSAGEGALAEASPMLYSTAIVCGAIQFEMVRRLTRIAGS